jgi:hypothetical protein
VARVYARWLAERDGIRLPDEVGTPDFEFVRSKLTGKVEKRARRVRFGKVVIDIPNWDFNPTHSREAIAA